MARPRPRRPKPLASRYPPSTETPAVDHRHLGPTPFAASSSGGRLALCPQCTNEKEIERTHNICRRTREHLQALPFTLDQVFEALAERCLPGARIVIGHPLGRQVLEQQRQEFPNCIVSDLPDKMTLEKVAVAHSFEMADFVDEPGFYLTVLKFNGA
ncbi:hypothetical protein NL676_016775 [Syzygium grande]|nr:hypothetical protein NL676_016775 [Syzygium grande]